MKKKLIAVGTNDPNPENWRPWNEVDLYVADDIDEALKMAGYSGYEAVEVDMSRSRLVMSAEPYTEDE